MPRGRLNASRKAKQEAARAKHAAEEATWAEHNSKAQERDNAREESRHAAMDAAMAAAISIHRPGLEAAHADNSLPEWFDRLLDHCLSEAYWELGKPPRKPSAAPMMRPLTRYTPRPCRTCWRRHWPNTMRRTLAGRVAEVASNFGAANYSGCQPNRPSAVLTPFG